MKGIATLEDKYLQDYKRNNRLFLLHEKAMVEERFSWIKLEVKGEILFGNGSLDIFGNKYLVEINYSSHLPGRFDRIFVRNPNIKYHKSIHLYYDLSLCLYHPIVDAISSKPIPLVKMIPWITEWCIHYEEWKKYGVWLGKEIKH